MTEKGNQNQSEMKSFKETDLNAGLHHPPHHLPPKAIFSFLCSLSLIFDGQTGYPQH